MPKSDSDNQTAKYNAPALSKGLDILELLASQSKGMKKSEIAKALDRSISEIFRMLAVLSERGYVALDQKSECYSLTPRLFEIAHRHPPIRRLNAIAGEVMEDLARTLNQSVHLAILHSSDILVIAQTDPPGNNVTSVRLGARVPLILTASGAVLTYQKTQKARNALCANLKDMPADAMDQFERNILATKANGYCESPSAVIQGVYNISVPVFSYSGDVIAAITVPFIKRLVASNDATMEETRLALIQAGKQMSHLIGAGASDFEETS
ncbi:IclR family transcriptional regulator [Falsihalocynthiibacter sp. S25ZX9]|uniref:IclR family transcriptional regulator n=1 Tax=Falsihalocynthiibacter sp. S25ZX9 TaxID=3240870 RepID=UPI0035106B0A